MPHDEQPSRRPEPEEVNAYKAYDSGKLTVILLAQHFRLPEVLRHIEAGRLLLVIPATNAPAADRGSPTPGIKAKPKLDRS